MNNRILIGEDRENLFGQRAVPSGPPQETRAASLSGLALAHHSEPLRGG
jgi:hypothetical protein